MSGKSCPILPPLWSLWRVESVATGITTPVSGGGSGGGQGPPLGPPPLPQQLWVEVWVPLGVLTEVIRAHKPFVAHWTLEVLLPCVCPDMPGQLVAPCKLLRTTAPGAGEGTLACVCPQMSLQVAALAVHLAAAWLSTSVALRPLPGSSTCTRTPQLPLRQPWRGRRRAVGSWHNLLSHPRQVGQDAGNHEHGGTGRG